MRRQDIAEVERLALLIEECAEVQQIACKILRHGYESHHPLGLTANRAMLEREIGDLRAAIMLMGLAGDVSWETVRESSIQKAASVRQWLHHQPGNLLNAVETACVTGDPS